MQNTFEHTLELLKNLENILSNNTLPKIERDIVLEKIRHLYEFLYCGHVSMVDNEVSDQTQKYGVYQGLNEDVDLFFDTDHESYVNPTHQEEQEAVLQREIEEEELRKQQEEEAKRKAEEERLRREAEEQRRREEEAKRKAEEEQKRIAEEQRRKAEEERLRREAEEQRRREEEAKRKAEEEQKRIAEEQRRKAEEERLRREAEEQRRREEEAKRKAEEEQKRIAEEQRRKAEEERLRREAEEQRRREEEAKKQQVPSDEDDLLQFMPKTTSTSNPTGGSNTQKPLSQTTPQRSLNDLFNEQREDHSLSAQFQRAKVTDLTKAISINDKFTFIKELFNNKGEEFSAAINQLNQCQNMDEAFNCLENLKQKFFWDSTSTAYLSLCDLLRRKFM